MSTLSSSPEPKDVKLSVNVDHVATLREARKAVYPSPVEAARIAEDAGAHGITVHLREDRRHIQDDDLVALRPVVRGKLNLEIAATEAMLRVAEQVRPDQVTLVPERPDEITTEGGLDRVAHHKRIQRAVNSLHAEEIAVSIFIDPDAAQLEPLLGLENVLGFEINTDAYTRASGEEQQRELDDLTHFAAAASESIGSLLLIVGIAFRPAAGMLAGTMLVAAAYHLSLPPDASGAGWSGASHALELLCVYVALLLTGPGSYALQLRRRRS